MRPCAVTASHSWCARERPPRRSPRLRRKLARRSSSGIDCTSPARSRARSASSLQPPRPASSTRRSGARSGATRRRCAISKAFPIAFSVRSGAPWSANWTASPIRCPRRSALPVRRGFRAQSVWTPSRCRRASGGTAVSQTRGSRVKRTHCNSCANSPRECANMSKGGIAPTRRTLHDCRRTCTSARSRRCRRSRRCAVRASAPRIRRAHASFLRELGWREFAHHLLCHFPHTAEQPPR